MSQQHHLHEAYSSRNPVPNVRKFLAEQAKKVNPVSKEAKEDVNETRREVRDPTTKSEVIIQDVDADYVSAIQNPHVLFCLSRVSDGQMTIPSANVSRQDSKKIAAGGTAPIVISPPQNPGPRD